MGPASKRVMLVLLPDPVLRSPPLNAISSLVVRDGIDAVEDEDVLPSCPLADRRATSQSNREPSKVRHAFRGVKWRNELWSHS